MTNELIEEIIEDEGFVGMPYDDSLGIPTIGMGTKLPLDEDEAKLILEYRLNKKIGGLLAAKPIVFTLPQDKQKVLFNMAYQMGVGGLLNFKKMWAAIEAHDWIEAGKEGRDSRWYTQTPNRAEKLMTILES